MAAIAEIIESPNFQETVVKTIASQFEVSEDFLKDVTKKTLNLVKKLSKQNLSKRLKEGGIFDITGDVVKAIFKKPKLPTTVEKISGITENKIPESVQPKAAKQEKDYLPEESKEVPVFKLAGITKEGYANLQENLPKLFEGIFKKMPKAEEKEEKQKFSEKGLIGLLPKGLLAMGGGLTLLLGGVAALVAGLQTEGPFKGLLKIFSKVGIQGGLKLLEKGAKTFIKNISSFVKAPASLLKTITKSIGKVFGVGAFKGVTTAIKGAKGIFAKMLGGLVKFLKPILKKLPLIGTIISWGFAFSRFKSGDVIGGIIDVLSGIASLFPGVGTAIAIGLDVLNAFLDYQAGGSTKEASAKKGGILLDWAKGLGSILMKAVPYLPVIGPLVDVGKAIAKGDWLEAAYNLVRAIPGVQYVIDILDYFTGGQTKETVKGGIVSVSNWLAETGKWLYEKAKDLPIIGQLIKTGEYLLAGKWAEALTSFSRVIPGLGWVYDMLGITEEKQTAMFQAQGDIIKNLWTWIKESLWSKVTGFVGGLIDGVKDWWNNLSWDPRSWVGAAPKELEKPNLEVPVPQPPAQTLTPMADGGIVTQPTSALVGEAGPEAVMPLDKLFNTKGGELNNTTLEKIASNTGSTNDAIKILGQAILKLAQTFEKRGSGGSIITTPGQSSQIPSASQIAAGNNDPIRAVRAQFAV